MVRAGQASAQALPELEQGRAVRTPPPAAVGAHQRMMLMKTGGMRSYERALGDASSAAESSGRDGDGQGGGGGGGGSATGGEGLSDAWASGEGWAGVCVCVCLCGSGCMCA